jgi:DNA-directed RNA polymerase subunit F
MVRHHHYPGAAGSKTESAVIHVADFMVSSLSIGKSGEPCLSAFVEEAWKQVGLDEEKAAQVVDVIPEKVQEVVKIFLN